MAKRGPVTCKAFHQQGHNNKNKSCPEFGKRPVYVVDGDEGVGENNARAEEQAAAAAARAAMGGAGSFRRPAGLEEDEVEHDEFHPDPEDRGAADLADDDEDMLPWLTQKPITLFHGPRDARTQGPPPSRTVGAPSCLSCGEAL